MQDNPLFSTAADFVNHTSRHIFLTGKAGTGKTTFLKFIRESTRKKCVVVAPTGVAAINAGGVTMHSFFQLPLGPFLPVSHRLATEGVTDQYTLFKNIRVSDQKRELFRDLELLIIDEVSMVRCDMLDAVDAILRYFRKMPQLPFGGVQVLYIGDLFQLPPVIRDSEWSLLQNLYKSPFFFDAKVVEETPPVYIELKKVYRQSQQSFIDILNRIRSNEVSQDDLDMLNARGRDLPDPNAKYVTLTTHNYKADRINADELRKLPGRVVEFKGVIDGDFPDKTLPTDPVLQLKEGAQVMFIRNDKGEERRYYNGKIATVKEIDEEGGICVLLADSEEVLWLERETWNNIRYSYNQQEERIDEEKLGSFTQYPVRLAWAITIHKSQGLTFTHAIVDAGESFAPGQVYVALSRCTSLEGLICRSRIVPGSVATDPRVVEFSNREATENTLPEILAREKRVYEHQQLLIVFDLQKLIESSGGFLKLLQAKQLPDMDSAWTAARNVLQSLKELQQIAMKFRQQLVALLEENDEDLLKERLAKGVAYFSDALLSRALSPIDAHLESLRGAKKIKKYLRLAGQYRNEIARKINGMHRVEYGNVSFDNGLGEVPMVDATPPRVRKPKREKGESRMETLAMLKSGLRAPEIAGRRGLVVGTIESHIAELVRNGDIDIRECMEDEKIERIASVIREIKPDSLQPVKSALGDGATYGEIRVVMTYLQLGEE